MLFLSSSIFVLKRQFKSCILSQYNFSLIYLNCMTLMYGIVVKHLGLQGRVPDDVTKSFGQTVLYFV